MSSKVFNAPYGKAAAKIERNVLSDKIWKLYTKVEELSKKYDSVPDDIDAVLKAYGELVNLCHDDSVPTEEIAWVFNDGKLRSDEEIEEFKKWQEKKDFRDGQFQLELLYRNTKASFRQKVIYHLYWMIPLVFMFLISFWECSHDGGFFFTCGLYGVVCIVTFLLGYYVLGLKHITLMWKEHKEQAVLYAMAGEKQPFDKALAISVGAYAVSLLGLLGGKKRR